MLNNNGGERLNKDLMPTKRLLHNLLQISGILCFLCMAAQADEIYSKNQKANDLYKKGDYQGALKVYDDALLLNPQDSKLKMNKGSALCKSGDLEKAEEAYNQSLSQKDKKALADAHYNLGNTLFMEGEQMLSQGNNSAQEKFKSALQHYSQTLDLRPSDKDAKWNLQLAYRQIQQMKNNQNNKDNKDNKDNKNNKNQNKNQNQNGQDKKNQDNQDKKDQDKNQQDKNQQQNQNKDNQDKQNQNDQQNQNQKQDDQSAKICLSLSKTLKKT